jgi:hypothetical protein
MTTINAPTVDPNCPTTAAINAGLSFLTGAINALDGRVAGLAAANPTLAGMATAADLSTHVGSSTPHQGMVRVAGSAATWVIDRPASMTISTAGSYAMGWGIALPVPPSRVLVTIEGTVPVSYAVSAISTTGCTIAVSGPCTVHLTLLRQA